MQKSAFLCVGALNGVLCIIGAAIIAGTDDTDAAAAAILGGIAALVYLDEALRCAGRRA